MQRNRAPAPGAAATVCSQSLVATATSASWQALGSTVVLRVTEQRALPRARRAVEDALSQIDRTCSRFRDDSDLSRVNVRAGEAVRVHPLLIEAVEVALRAARLTGGDVDPTLGRLLELAGYDRDWHALDGDGEELRSQPPPEVAVTMTSAWPKVRVDRSRATVCVPQGAQLDLGATAKAWAADRAAAAAAHAGGCGALVAVGGDIATHGPSPAQGWPVHVTDDHRSDPSAPGQTVRIRDGGLATSSTAVRRWTRAGRHMHHIIDPRSGVPVRDTWRTVSVAAADCTQANVAATAAIVRGERATQWLAQLGLPARLVRWDGRVHAVAGWPAAHEPAVPGPDVAPWQLERAPLSGLGAA
jgi:FAD:protein FMN transferase